MHRFNPANWQMLVSEERARLTPPAAVLGQLPLHPGLTVADIGCGPGFFTLPLAERLPDGVVHAVDIEPVMLEALRERAARAGRPNIATHLAEPESVPLPAASLDGAFLAMTFLFIPAAARRGYLTALRVLLRPGGWLAILDWERRQNPAGGNAGGAYRRRLGDDSSVGPQRVDVLPARPAADRRDRTRE